MIEDVENAIDQLIQQEQDTTTDWDKFKQYWGIHDFDMNTFANSMGYDSEEEMRDDTTPTQLRRKYSKQFVDALILASAKAQKQR